MHWRPTENFHQKPQVAEMESFYNPRNLRKAVFASDSNVTQSRWMCLQGQARRREL